MPVGFIDKTNTWFCVLLILFCWRDIYHIYNWEVNVLHFYEKFEDTKVGS